MCYSRYLNNVNTLSGPQHHMKGTRRLHYECVIQKLKEKFAFSLWFKLKSWTMWFFLSTFCMYISSSCFFYIRINYTTRGWYNNQKRYIRNKMTLIPYHQGLIQRNFLRVYCCFRCIFIHFSCTYVIQTELRLIENVIYTHTVYPSKCTRLCTLTS